MRENEPIISVSGLRGIVGRSLDGAVARRYAQACSELLGPGPMLVGRDGRESGIGLAAEINDQLSICGRSVLNTGILATPTMGVLIRSQQAAGGIQITASHNPAEYNGIKVFGPEGRVVSSDFGWQIAETYARIPHATAGTGRHPAVELADTTGDHLQRVLGSVDVERIRRRGFRVVLDSNHGAGSILGQRLLEELGVHSRLLGANADGRFEHPPEPTADNLAAVADQAMSWTADATFCQDPDADRLAIINHRGHYVGEEYTLGIAVQRILQRRRGSIVINCATSRLSAELARRHGCQCYVSAVGEANVCDEMIRRQAVYGGEGNGGTIDPTIGYVRDSFAGMAQILDWMAETGSSIAQIVAGFPQYHIHKAKVDLNPQKLDALLGAVPAAFPGSTINRLDGIRLEWDDCWLLVRPSNTEPIVRTIAEAPALSQARQICDRVLRLAAEL